MIFHAGDFFNTYLFYAASFDTFHFMKMIQSIRIQYFHFFHRWFSKSTIWFIRQTIFMFWIPWITFQHLVNITFWSEPLFTVYRFVFAGDFQNSFKAIEFSIGFLLPEMVPFRFESEFFLLLEIETLLLEIKRKFFPNATVDSIGSRSHWSSEWNFKKIIIKKFNF